MSLYDIIKSPIITEKTTKLVDKGQYTFSVALDATKPMVKSAIEEAFNVVVMKVRIVNVRKKPRRVGKYSGFKAGVKKAIVTLQQGQTIEQYKI